MTLTPTSTRDTTPRILTGDDVDVYLTKLWEKDREGVYRVFGSGRWFCIHCSQNGDRFLMRAHNCHTCKGDKK
jgi:hypothetical protein